MLSKPVPGGWPLDIAQFQLVASDAALALLDCSSCADPKETVPGVFHISEADLLLVQLILQPQMTNVYCPSEAQKVSLQWGWSLVNQAASLASADQQADS